MDWTSSCPFSRGCCSHSGKYDKSLSEVEVDEAMQREGEYAVKVNHDTTKDNRNTWNSLGTTDSWREYLWGNLLWRISLAIVCITSPIFCSHEGRFPMYLNFAHTADSSSNALFSFSLCVLFKRQWGACISMEKSLASWCSGATRHRRLLHNPRTTTSKKKKTAYIDSVPVS